MRITVDFLVQVLVMNLCVFVLEFQQEGIPLMMEMKLGCGRVGPAPVGKPAKMVMLTEVNPQ